MGKKRKNKKRKNFSNSLYRDYRRWNRDNFISKTKQIIKKAVNYTKNDYKVLGKVFNTVNGQIIGSELSTLLYKAHNEPEDYIQNRYYYLKDIANFVKNELAYIDLFEFIKYCHKNNMDMFGALAQVQFELVEIVDILTPFNMQLVGLNKNNPIFMPSKFPYTQFFVGKVNNLPPKENWSKKHYEIMYQNYARSNIKNYLAMTFGFYNNSCLDLVPQNSVNLKWFENVIELPRKLYESEKLIDIVKNNKKYVMNKNGVVVDCYNAGDIETIIFYENKDILLYKVIFKTKGWIVNEKGRLIDDVNGAEYTGIIALDNFNKNIDESSFFISTLGSMMEYMNTVNNLVNFVLECYADIVCGTDYCRKEDKVDTSSEILFNNQYSDNEIEVYFEKKGKIGVRYTPLSLYNEGKKETSRSSKHTREKYYVTGHLRKLPDGSCASYEAKQNALEYGLDIPDGYTFVRPYYSGVESIRTHYTKVVED